VTAHGLPVKRIHIVGCSPRSGTTLLAELVAASHAVHVEPKEVPVWNRPDRAVDVYVTKRPQDILVADFALRALPNLDVVCMVRDPRDVVVSIHGADPDRYWASLKFWKAYEPKIERLRHHDRFTVVRYEDLVRDPDAEQKRLVKQLRFREPSRPFSEFATTASPSEASLLALGGLRPVSTSSIGQWRHHLPRVAGQLAQHGSISDSLVRHGYEEDASWETSLDGVEPDLRPSHWPEHFDRSQLARRRRRAMANVTLVAVAERLPRLPSTTSEAAQ
jgi:hypothetical protein